MNLQARIRAFRSWKPIAGVIMGGTLVAGVVHAMPMFAQADTSPSYAANQDITIQSASSDASKSEISVAFYTLDPSVCTDQNALTSGNTFASLTQISGTGTQAKSTVNRNYQAGDCVLTKLHFRRNQINDKERRFTIALGSQAEATSMGGFVGAYYVDRNGNLTTDNSATWGWGVVSASFPNRVYEKPRGTERNTYGGGEHIARVNGADLYFIRKAGANEENALSLNLTSIYRQMRITGASYIDDPGTSDESETHAITIPYNPQSGTTTTTTSEAPKVTWTAQGNINLGADLNEKNWSAYADRIQFQYGAGGAAAYNNANPFSSEVKSISVSEDDRVRARIQYNIGTADEPNWKTAISTDGTVTAKNTTTANDDPNAHLYTFSLSDPEAIERMSAIKAVQGLASEDNVSDLCSDLDSIVKAGFNDNGTYEESAWVAKQQAIAKCIDSRVESGMKQWATMAKNILGDSNGAAVDQILNDVNDELTEGTVVYGLENYYNARVNLYRALAVTFAQDINSSGYLSTDIDSTKLVGDTMTDIDKAMSAQFDGKSLAEIGTTPEEKEQIKENAQKTASENITKSISQLIDSQTSNNTALLNDAQKEAIKAKTDAIANDDTLSPEQKLDKAKELRKEVISLSQAIQNSKSLVADAEKKYAGQDDAQAKLGELKTALQTAVGAADATASTVENASLAYTLGLQSVDTQSVIESPAVSSTGEYRKELSTSSSEASEPSSGPVTTVYKEPASGSTKTNLILLILGLLGLGGVVAYFISTMNH
ncbi:MAG: hypothetical protein Q3962_06650 [Corynebacterium sp.]|nr:hypothetical protein [Corynebacterium sp.]